MKTKMNLANRIWEIVYPVCMYYAAITVGIYIAQLVFGTSNEAYMLCKIIGSVVAIPVVYSDYKRDKIMSGKYGQKIPMSLGTFINVLLVMGITICISVSLNNIISMSPLMEMSAEYQNASNAFYGSTIGVELLGSALITPYLEELLHRGVVYNRLRKMMGLWPAVLISALVFAGLHFNIVQFIYAFLLGIVFALFVEKTGRLYPAVLAHIVANTIAVLRTETGLLSNTVDKSVFAWSISIILLIIGMIGLAVYIRNLSKRNRSNE